MNDDIDFKQDGYRFLLRCSAIITDKKRTKVLLFAIPVNSFWLLPGGRITYQEDSYHAIKREMREELGLTNECQLICVEENFLQAKKIQNIEFIYHMTVDNIDNIKPLEDKKQIFKVVAINNLSNYELKPNYLTKLIKEFKNEEILHKINVE